jgi:hypothetical protein
MGHFKQGVFEVIRTQVRWVRAELIEKHGAFSAVSFRSNKDMKEVGEGRELIKKHGAFSAMSFSSNKDMKEVG